METNEAAAADLTAPRTLEDVAALMPAVQKSAAEMIFQTEIAPLLRQVYEKCEANGMTFMSAVEIQPGQAAHVRFVGPTVSLDMIIAMHAALTGADVDQFLIDVATYLKGNRYPHESNALEGLGVPKRPEHRQQ